MTTTFKKSILATAAIITVVTAGNVLGADAPIDPAIVYTPQVTPGTVQYNNFGSQITPGTNAGVGKATTNDFVVPNIFADNGKLYYQAQQLTLTTGANGFQTTAKDANGNFIYSWTNKIEFDPLSVNINNATLVGNMVANILYANGNTCGYSAQASCGITDIIKGLKDAKIITDPKALTDLKVVTPDVIVDKWTFNGQTYSNLADAQGAAQRAADEAKAALLAAQQSGNKQAIAEAQSNSNNAEADLAAKQKALADAQAAIAKELEEALAAAKKAAEQAAREAAAKQAADHDLKVGARTRKTNSTVAGAIGVNIVANEFINPALEQFGGSVSSSVGGNFENPELRVGINVDLSKQFGEDFEGFSVNAGYGVESGEIGVGVRKTWQVAEYVHTSVGASIGAEGVRVGPEVMLGNADFGVGFAMWGPLPVPQIKVFGYTASVVPHLALANAVVGLTTVAYKAIRSEMNKEEVAVSE